MNTYSLVSLPGNKCCDSDLTNRHKSFWSLGSYENGIARGLSHPFCGHLLARPYNVCYKRENVRVNILERPSVRLTESSNKTHGASADNTMRWQYTAAWWRKHWFFFDRWWSPLNTGQHHGNGFEYYRKIQWRPRWTWRILNNMKSWIVQLA